MICEPKGGWRHGRIDRNRRTAVDFAHQMRWLVDQAYFHVQGRPAGVGQSQIADQLGSAIYKAIWSVRDARRIAKRLVFHHSPTHSSWLNMAEIELSVFRKQCLNRRVGDEALRREVAATRSRAQRYCRGNRLGSSALKTPAVNSNISSRED